MFELKKLRDGVFHLCFESSRELSMAFVRYQDFYECLNDKIRGKKFTLVEQMGHYVRDMADDKDADWTYTSDWGGFNIPAQVIQDVYDLGIDDPNCYDALMKGIYGLVMMDTKGERAYLIGTTAAEKKDDEKAQEKSDRLAQKYIDHEMTHAMFYIEDEYKIRVENLINGTSKELREELLEIMKDVGYPQKVAVDEINAYITTGENGHFDLIKPELESELDALRVSLKSLHRKVFQSWKNEEQVNYE